MSAKFEKLYRSLSQEVDALKELVNNVDPQLKTLLDVNQNLITKVNEMANAIEALKAAVENEKSVSAGLVALCDSISSQLKEALASGDMGAVQQLANDLSGNTRTLQEAVLRNTPAVRVEPAPIDSGVPAPSDPIMPADAAGDPPPPAPVE